MSVRISPSSRLRPVRAPFDAQATAVPRLARADGGLQLSFARRDGATRLIRRDQREPMRVLTPYDRALGCAGATLVNVGGGLAGGDRLRQGIDVGAGAAALATTQAAEKVYRSSGAQTQVATELTVAEDGWLEWLPQETILFDRARLRRDLTARVAGSGRLLAGELLVLGRTASGERLSESRLLDRWRVHHDGRLVWADGLKLAPPNAGTIDAPAGFGGQLAMATLIYVAADAAQRLETARRLLADGPGQGGATVLGPVLLVRLLAPTGARLRQAVAGFWCGFRAEAADLPAVLPRAWST